MGDGIGVGFGGGLLAFGLAMGIEYQLTCVTRTHEEQSVAHSSLLCLVLHMYSPSRQV